ncbi:hypothetical protein EXU57_00145 [Segetibacter sp. 3557_3]|uniref:hypothetical protein n=1 Tax=Segetibacter sp. 3557_3 TaxID=2547429 RepID=UPI001058BB1B|nr:hypothetical protein [Segetibacter sp. 3557_3]TDH28527.1 hypothetical protein EXU57_00145 [Segetibacter sp. 3557_3]
MKEKDGKPKRNIWLYLFLALIIAGGIAAYIGLTTTRKDDQATTEETADFKDPSVEEYVSYVETGQRMDLNHEYTSKSIRLLATAIVSKGKSLDLDLTAVTGRVEKIAAHITQDPLETSHADSIRSAAELLSANLERIQKNRYPKLNAQTNAVSTAAKAINADVLTLQQEEKVKAFFQKSAELLESMN